MGLGVKIPRMYAVQLFLNGKKGISGCQLERELGVTYKTAWRMLHQIRSAMGNGIEEQFKNTIVEMDEAYLGGKPRKDNKHDDDDLTPPVNKRGRGTKKTAVVGVIDRENKKIHVEIATPNHKGQQLTGKQLLNILRKVSKADSKNLIITDQFPSYENEFCFRYNHRKEEMVDMVLRQAII
jgi:hypothetical protein